MPLLHYVGHCKELGWSVAKINHCISGLAFGFRMRGLQDLMKCFLVVQALKGWRRGQAVVDKRWLVFFQLLQDLGSLLDHLCKSAYKESLFRVAFSLAFFGALQLGELVSPSVSRAGGLREEDVYLFYDRVEFRLRRGSLGVIGLCYMLFLALLCAQWCV